MKRINIKIGYGDLVLMSIETYENIVNEFENVILSLENFSYRDAKRKVGAYRNKGYIQLMKAKKK